MEQEQQSQTEKDDFDSAWDQATGAPAEQAAAEEEAEPAKEGQAEENQAPQAREAEAQGPDEHPEEVEIVRLSKAEVDALKAERDALKAERDRHMATANSMKGRLQALQRERAEPKPRADQEPQAEPDPDAYETADAYLDALEQYEAKKSTGQEHVGGKADSSQDGQQARPKEPEFTPSEDERVAFEVAARLEQSRRDGMISKAISKHPDFQAVVMSEGVPLSQPMVEALFGLGGDDFTAAAYHLGKHPDEARAIASLGGQYGPIMQAQRIVNLAERLRAGQEAKTRGVDRAAAQAMAVPARNRSGPPKSGPVDKNDFDGAWEEATSERSRRP